MISEQIAALHSQLPAGVTLVAVSKYHPVAALLQAYEAGQRVFGESHVQELVAKQALMPADVQWHFIGHLQTNKVKYIAPFVSLIHAVDSLRLLREIDKQAGRCGRRIDCLLELHLAQEETKYGFTPDELTALLDSDEWATLPHVRIRGLMTMATYTDDTEQIRREFRTTHDLYRHARDHVAAASHWDMLSMGMSHDYPVAIEEGATLVRIGTSIFGQRQY